MTVVERAYQGAADFTTMQQFTMQITAQAGDCGMVHIGDMAHRLFGSMRKYDPADLVRLWEDSEGRLLGWLICYPSFEGFDYQVHPDYCSSGLEAEILETGEAITYAAMQKLDRAGKAVGTDVWEGDTRKISFLEGHGYAFEAHTYDYTTLALNDPLPEADLPQGFSIRPAAGAHEAGKLAEVHRRSFGSTWTAAEYRQHMLKNVGYAAEREFVVVAPEGGFAAFCVTWVDVLNKTFLFEPVGTHEDFRRMGLGSALMVEVMRRYKAQGLHTAIVSYIADNERSRAFYHSLGFRVKYKILDYRK